MKNLPVTLVVSWLLVGPTALWAIAMIYLPFALANYSTRDCWGVAVALAFGALLSLVAHDRAHRLAAGYLGDGLPARYRLYPFGDAVPPLRAGTSPSREAFIALAGPLCNLVVAALSLLLWHRSSHPLLDVTALFLFQFNGVVAIANLAPGLPLDGGRLVRALFWGMFGNRRVGEQAGQKVGLLLIGLLLVWSLYLLSRQAYLSGETAIITLMAALLLLLARADRPTGEEPSTPLPLWLSPIKVASRGAAGGLLLLLLLAVSLSLLPMVDGIYAPGPAVRVEPAVTERDEQGANEGGNFMATTVMVQTPIIAAQWLYAQLSPSVELVPSDQVMPARLTPQELMQENLRLLEESEIVAAVVALRSAGYQAELTEIGVEVQTILPDSPAFRFLKPGDRIVRLDGRPIESVQELMSYVSNRAMDGEVSMLVERDGQQISLSVPLMAAPEGQGTARLGVMVRSAGVDVNLPFSIQIDPQKIGGGPSAGLLFALAIYDMITPGDLSGGRVVAGTGTIEPDGRVGPIGGVAQKVMAAERAGADYFLVPPDNYEIAQRTARRIQVVQVATFDEAVSFLRKLTVANRR